MHTVNVCVCLQGGPVKQEEGDKIDSGFVTSVDPICPLPSPILPSVLTEVMNPPASGSV